MSIKTRLAKLEETAREKLFPLVIVYRDSVGLSDEQQARIDEAKAKLSNLHHKGGGWFYSRPDNLGLDYAGLNAKQHICLNEFMREVMRFCFPA